MSEIDERHARLLYQGRDGLPRVYENSDYRWMSLHGEGVHSAMPLSCPWQVVLPYYPLLLSALLFQPQAQSALLMGLGGGDLVRYLLHYLPGIQLQVWDNSAEVVQVCHDYFYLPSEGGQVEVVIEDVCEFPSRPVSRQHEMLFVDVYGEDALPECFYQAGFYRSLAGSITDDGVVAINLVVRDEADALTLLRLIREAFNSQVLCLAVGNYLNIVVLAFKNIPEQGDVASWRSRAQELAARFELDFDAMIDNLVQSNHLQQPD